jgi:hypothetical protein
VIFKGNETREDDSIFRSRSSESGPATNLQPEGSDETDLYEFYPTKDEEKGEEQSLADLKAAFANIGVGASSTTIPNTYKISPPLNAKKPSALATSSKPARVGTGIAGMQPLEFDAHGDTVLKTASIPIDEGRKNRKLTIVEPDQKYTTETSNRTRKRTHSSSNVLRENHRREAPADTFARGRSQSLIDRGADWGDGEGNTYEEIEEQLDSGIIPNRERRFFTDKEIHRMFNHLEHSSDFLSLRDIAVKMDVHTKKTSLKVIDSIGDLRAGVHNMETKTKSMMEEVWEGMQGEIRSEIRRGFLAQIDTALINIERDAIADMTRIKAEVSDSVGSVKSAVSDMMQQVQQSTAQGVRKDLSSIRNTLIVDMETMQDQLAIFKLNVQRQVDQMKEDQEQIKSSVGQMAGTLDDIARVLGTVGAGRMSAFGGSRTGGADSSSGGDSATATPTGARAAGTRSNSPSPMRVFLG